MMTLTFFGSIACVMSLFLSLFWAANASTFLSFTFWFGFSFEIETQRERGR